jgi:arginine dihydrolase
MTYGCASELDFRLGELPPSPRPGRVLLTTPEYFQVEYVINPHMENHVGSVDSGQARKQWNALKDAYEALGVETHVQAGLAGMPDMVFCANQTLPVPPVQGERPQVILSRMFAAQRADEVAAYEEAFGTLGYDPVRIPDEVGSFEGMGDALWHPGVRLLWGGSGFRTDPAVYHALSEKLNVPVVTIRLEDPDFYHLDTCLSVLSRTSALIYPGAFDRDALSLIHALFERVIEAPESEARRLFACNAHCPDEESVLIQRGCVNTVSALQTAGFKVVELDTDQFLKAGGSVFCMKQMFW